MLRAYTYKPQEAGFQKWPEGILRLNNTFSVDKPEDADVFIFPPSLMNVQERGRVANLPYMNGREERHIFFDVSDFDQTYELKCLFIRCNLKRHMREADPNSIPWAWPVCNYPDVAEVPAEGFKYDVSFHGWLSTKTRIEAINSCLANPKLKTDSAQYTDFYGYVERDNKPEADRRMAAYKLSMKHSRIGLCGESIPGVFPYRFFEAMSMGRVAMLFSSDYNLPFQDEIPWDKIVLRYPREESPHAGTLVQNFINSHSDEVIINMGRQAREYWVKYLNRDDWPTTMTMAVESKLRQIGVKIG